MTQPLSKYHCRACGAPITPGAQFCARCGRALPPTCAHCGAALKGGVNFCEACGKPVAAPAPAASQAAAQPLPAETWLPPAAPAAAAQPAPVAKKKRGNPLSKAIVVLVGLALLFVGVRGPLLLVLGKSTLATVTSVEAGEEDDYTVNYRFSAGGKAMKGSTSVNTLNTSTLPKVGSMLSVRYLPALPTINLPAKDAEPSLVQLAAMAAGVVMIVLGFKLNWQFSASDD